MIVMAEGDQLWRNLPQQTVKKAVDKLGPAKIQQSMSGKSHKCHKSHIIQANLTRDRLSK